MSNNNNNDPLYAPGWPGIAPRWTSSAKTGVGTALNLNSRVWFTLSHGVLDEIYFPRVDQACTRDFGLIVTDGRSFFSEEKRHCTYQNVPFEPGVPAYELINTSTDGRYRIEKEVLTDPVRNVVLQRIRFVPLKGKQRLRPSGSPASCRTHGVMINERLTARGIRQTAASYGSARSFAAAS